MPKLSLLFVGLSLFLLSRSQDKPPVKFGKISAADLKTKSYSIDSSAAAVIIADIGSSEIAGNLKGWFSIEFKHFKRIHILSKSAYDLANVEILLYNEGNNEEKLENLKAHTYNLENGKVVETKVDIKRSVYRSTLDKNHIVQKFAFPAIKVGSIIEYEYTISSDFIFNLQPWKFQGDHPVLWSEYYVSIPEFFYYVFLQHGEIKKTQTSRQQTFRVRDERAIGERSVTEPFVAGINNYRMIMKNTLPLKEESFTSTLDNHIAKVEFQLAEFRNPLTAQNIMGDWEDVCQTLLNDENFGGQLNKDNSWMNDDLKIAIGNATKEEEKAKNIYKFLRDNFTCINYYRLYADQPLKNVLKNKKGSEAEINLLLIAMLRKAGFDADPVMLSTRSHGYAYSNYPLLERFNYVVCRLKMNDKIVYLDASRPLGYGRLHWECYNGHARVINEEATPIEFLSDSLTERKVTSLMLSSNDKGELVGMLQQVPGYYESYDMRNGIKEKGLKEYIKEIEKDMPPDVAVKNYRIERLEKLDEQVQVNYDISLGLDKKDIIYLDPMFGEGFTENPFASENRTYPVEMPYAFDEVYVLRMNVPHGYEVSEMPVSTKVNFDEEGRSFFEYLVENADGVISLRSRVKMHRSYFLPDEYKILHDFFSLVVNKQNEKIVLKKMKKL
jgi:hypothetical protein